MKIYGSTEISKAAISRNVVSEQIFAKDTAISNVFAGHGTGYTATAGHISRLESITLETREFDGSQTDQTLVKVGFIVTDGVTTEEIILNTYDMSTFNERRSMTINPNWVIPIGFEVILAASSQKATHTVLFNGSGTVNVYEK